MKKHYFLYPIVFIVGLIIGGYTYGVLSIKNMQIVIDTNKAECNMDFENRVYQAYREEDPKVSIWALKNFVVNLNKRTESTWDSNNTIQTGLRLSYIRIALMYKKLNNNEEYKQYINKALLMTNETFNDKTYTEDDLINSVKKLDQNFK